MTRKQPRSVSQQPPAVLVVDPDAVVASATESVEQVFGYAPTELVDAPIDTVIADSAANPVAGERPATGTARARCRHASGTEFTARVGWAPLGDAPRVAVTVEDAVGAREQRPEAAPGDAAGSRLGASGAEVADGDAVADTPERQREDRSLARRNAELRERVARLERRNEELQEFTDVVAHDLRNPLTAAQACVELAEREAGDVSDHVADLESAHERMRDLIDDLLTLTRHGRAVGETQPVPLSAVVADAWTTVGTDHPDHDPTLDVEASLPRVEADAERLRTLLENLFGNAIDHASPDVTVRVGALPDGFYVADDGPGIPPDERERVFEHGYSTDSDGTGYGLAIVEGIASGHGWEASVTESRDGGARFEFRGVDHPTSAGASGSSEGTDD